MSSKAMFQRGRIIGVTHTTEGEAMMRVPRSVKVGIGLPQGPEIHVYIDANGKWCVAFKDASGENQIERLNDKDSARRFYRDTVKKVPERKFPRKLPYFIFTRINSDGVFTPDFEATELHGSLPTSIDIVFTDAQPLVSQLQMWSKSALLCEGDGMNARRSVTIPQNAEEKRLADAAVLAGEKYFAIENGCRERGCPFAKRSQDGRPPSCKPLSHLRFQLLQSPSLGSEVTFDTTSYRSTSWLFSSIEQLRSMANGYITGVPLKLRVAPFKVNYDEKKTSTAFGVWVDLSGNDVTEMRQKLIEAGMKFNQLGPAEQQRRLVERTSPLQMPAASSESTGHDETSIIDEDEEFSEGERAAALNAEFYTDEDQPDEPAAMDQTSEPEIDQELIPVYEAGAARGMKKDAIEQFIALQRANGRTVQDMLDLLRILGGAVNTIKEGPAPDSVSPHPAETFVPEQHPIELPPVATPEKTPDPPKAAPKPRQSTAKQAPTSLFERHAR